MVCLTSVAQDDVCETCCGCTQVQLVYFHCCLVFHWMSMPLSILLHCTIHFTLGRYLGYFQFFPIISKAVINIFEGAFSCYTFLKLGVELLGHGVGICLSLVDDFQFTFPLAVFFFFFSCHLPSFFKLLFNYSCLHFLPIPPPHPSRTHLPLPPPPFPLILSMCTL